MRRLRSSLTASIVVVLLLQAAGAAVAIGLACCQEAAEPAAMECCAKGGPGHICLLMNRGGDTTGRCRMKSTCVDHDAAPVMPFAFSAPLPRVLRVEPPHARLGLAPLAALDVRTTDLTREGPPPKA